MPSIYEYNINFHEFSGWTLLVVVGRQVNHSIQHVTFQWIQKLIKSQNTSDYNEKKSHYFITTKKKQSKLCFSLSSRSHGYTPCGEFAMGDEITQMHSSAFHDSSYLLICIPSSILFSPLSLSLSLLETAQCRLKNCLWKLLTQNLIRFFSFKNRTSLPGLGLVSISQQFTCTGKGVNIYSANQWTRISCYDHFIGWLQELIFCDQETE